MAKGEDITTRFRVDISDLKKGISEANKNIKLANAQFKAATSGMDDWAKSSDGVRAKLKQLTSILTEQKNKLQNYKDQQERLNDAYKENEKRADELKAKLQQLANQGVSKTSEEYKKYERALNDVEKEQQANKTASDNLRITILNQEAAVEQTNKEIRNYNSSLEELENESHNAEDAVNDLEDASHDASDGFTIMKGALSQLVADGFRKAIDAAKEFAKTMITTAAEVRAETAQFEQTFGDMGDEAEAAIKRVANSTGILDTRLKVSGAQIYAFARSNGATIPEAMELMETALMASADSAAYYDKSLEESAETLQSFLKGNYANDAALGVSATEFTRNAKATELFGKKYNDLTEIQKQQTLLKMVTDSQKVSGAMGQAAREADGWENVQGNLNEAWRQFKAQVGTPFLEALIPIIQQVTTNFQKWADSVDWDAFSVKVKKAIDKVIEVFKWFIDNKDVVIAAISGIIAAFAVAKIATFITTVLGVVKAIKAAAAAQGLWNAVMTANPIGLIATAIGLLVAGVILLIKNWDKVKEAFISAWEAIKSTWGNVANWFNDNVIDPIKNFFSSVGSAIGAFFSEAKNKIVSVWTTVANWFNEKVIQPIKSIFEPIVSWFAKLFMSIFNTWKSIIQVIIGILQGLWTIITTLFGKAYDWFNTNVIQPIANIFSKMWDKIKNGARLAWEAVKTVWNIVKDWFNTKIIQPVSNFFTQMWDGLKNGAKNAWEGIKNAFSPVIEWFKGKFTKAWDGVKKVFSTGGKIFSGIKEGIENTFKKVVNKIISGINKVISVPFNAINKALDKLRDFGIGDTKPFGNLPSISVPQIPELATGIAKAKKGHKYLLEGKHDETVLPLHKNAQWIKAMAGSMLNQMNAKGIKSLDSNATGLTANSNVNNFTQIINAPKQPSRIELYRQTRNLLELKGGN